MLTKKEAAKYLGVSPQTLERDVKDEKLSVRCENSPNGEVALFDPDGLAQFAEDKKMTCMKPVSSFLLWPRQAATRYTITSLI